MSGRRVIGRRFAIVAAGAALAAPALIGRARAAPLALRLSSSQANDPRYANGRVYYDFLVKRLGENGLGEQVKITFFPDNQLGQEIDVANSVKLGVIDLMVTGTSIWANLVPDLGLMDLGYLFSSYQQQTRALDAGAGRALAAAVLARANTRIAGWAYDFGARCLLSKTEVTGPPDLAGKKIRTLPNPVITECLRLMGAAATPLAFGEVYTALQAGVLDGLEHNPPTIVASKLYETAKHFTRTEHIFTALGAFLSEATFRRMPEAMREPFLDACTKASADTRVRALAAESEATEILRTQGVTINPCDKEAFRARVLPQTEAFMKTHPDAKPIIEAIKATPA
jgi:TRAP-type C4-dicarboxylate transport system substrate-binding protein